MDLRHSLQDLNTREKQLEEHLLRSVEYTRQLDQQSKRLLALVYLGIVLMLLWLLFIDRDSAQGLSPAALLLIGLNSLFSLTSCFLLIRTRRALHRLNENFLNKKEKEALSALRSRRMEMQGRLRESPAQV